MGQGIFDPEHRKSLTVQAIKHLEEVREAGVAIRNVVLKALQTLGPLTEA